MNARCVPVVVLVALTAVGAGSVVAADPAAWARKGKPTVVERAG
ncbi:MAG: hypothetical protein JWO38_4214 [Gemmataceae bacterium]|nr:hypothetical protein [Gemmataceae bacterium]